jgi:hypothetical protein
VRREDWNLRSPRTLAIGLWSSAIVTTGNLCQDDTKLGQVFCRAMEALAFTEIATSEACSPNGSGGAFRNVCTPV